MNEGNDGRTLCAPTDQIVDVPMKSQRSLATVTAEIRTLQDAARRMAIEYSIEIGRKLVEAKSMVAHGEWTDYLREELGFSQSTANNHMRMFEAYGAEQISLNGATVKSQAFANLSYTQALALLALPSEEEREAFVAGHDMASMSTRELQEELRRRGEMAEEGTNPSTADPSTALMGGPPPLRAGEVVTEDAEALERRIAELEDQLTEARSGRDVAMMQSQKAEKAAQQAGEDLASLKKSLDAEKKAAKDLKKKLDEALKNPQVPFETLEKLRQEALEAAQAAQKAESESLEEARDKYVQAEQEASKARKEAEEASRTAEAAAKSLAALQAEKEALQKELALSAPEMTIFKARFERVQRDLMELLRSVDGLPEDKRGGAWKALAALIESARSECAGAEGGQ